MALALERPALVLNKNWQVIRTTPAKEAISLVAKGSARILDPETYEAHDLVSWNAASEARQKFEGSVIRSSRLALVVPEVIVLTAYDGMAERSVVFSRRNLYKRDKYTCMYCGVQPGPAELSIEHVVPKSKGGRSSWTNCVLACVKCNAKKANRTPAEAGMTLRKVPKKPSWKSLTEIPPKFRRESWEAFLSRAYWEVELSE